MARLFPTATQPAALRTSPAPVSSRRHRSGFRPKRPVFALCLSLTLGVCLVGAPAQAKDPPKPVAKPSSPAKRTDRFHDLFSVYLGGLHVADFAVDFADRGRSFQASLVLESRGMLEVFKELRALARGAGWFTDGTSPLKSIQPEGYTRVYRETGKSGVKEVRYTLGHPPEGYNNGKEDDRVPSDLRWGALDPFSTFAVARRLLREIKSGDHVTLPVFDGKLRYDFEADMGEPTTITLNGGTIEALPLTVRPVPISGFSDKHARSWADKTMILYVAADDPVTPVKLVLKNALGGFVINRVGPCDAVDAPCPVPLPKYLSARNDMDR